LEQEGYRVWAATDYSAAERMLSENDYDAVLADIHLEDRTAMGLLRWPSTVAGSGGHALYRRARHCSLRAMMKMKVNYLFFKPIDLGRTTFHSGPHDPRRASAMAASG